MPAEVAWEHLVMPVAFDGETLVLAARNPQNIAMADKLRFRLATGVRLVPAARSDIETAIERHYGPRATGDSVECLIAASHPARESTDSAVDFIETQPPAASTRQKKLRVSPRRGVRRPAAAVGYAGSVS